MSASSRPTGTTRGSFGTRLDDGAAALRVARRRHDAGRLVQEQVGERLLRDAARRRPRRGRALDERVQLAGLAVDGDAAGLDQVVGLAARGDAGAGEVGVEAHEWEDRAVPHYITLMKWTSQGRTGLPGVARPHRGGRADDPGGRRHARRRLGDARPVRRRRESSRPRTTRRRSRSSRSWAAARRRARRRRCARSRAKRPRRSFASCSRRRRAARLRDDRRPDARCVVHSRGSRDLLCFELAWFALWRLPLRRARGCSACTLAVAVRAAFVGHFAVDFYGVALAFVARVRARLAGSSLTDVCCSTSSRAAKHRHVRPEKPAQPDRRELAGALRQADQRTVRLRASRRNHETGHLPTIDASASEHN